MSSNFGAASNATAFKLPKEEGFQMNVSHRKLTNWFD